MTFSQFAAYYSAHANQAPKAVRAAVRASALARVSERFAQERADSPLDFSDLADRLETAIAP